MTDDTKERIRKVPSDYFDPYYDYTISVAGLETRPMKASKSLKEDTRGKFSSILSDNDKGMDLLQVRLKFKTTHGNNMNSVNIYEKEQDVLVVSELNVQMELFGQN